MSRDSYIPALRFRALTRIYDPVLALTVRERTFKERLLDQADLSGDLRVLDLACGTGTLTVRAKQRAPQIEITGVDADQEVLDRAAAKTRRAGFEIGFDRALSTKLPYEAERFDRVLSSLFFHHLVDEDKRATIREVVRTLSLSIRTLDGFEPTRANLQGRPPELFADAGLERVRTEGTLRTVYGTLAFYSAVKS